MPIRAPAPSKMGGVRELYVEVPPTLCCVAGPPGECCCDAIAPHSCAPALMNAIEGFNAQIVVIRPDGPFDLSLSLRATALFLPPSGLIPRSLRFAILCADKPGPPTFVTRHTGLLVVPPAAVGANKPTLRIVFAENCSPEPGDWILSLADGATSRVNLLARINHVKLLGGLCYAFSSLFWHLPQGGPLVSEALASLRSLLSLRRGRVRQQSIRSLVSWFAGHYRVGIIHVRHLLPGTRGIDTRAPAR